MAEDISLGHGREENWLDSMPVWRSEVELVFREGGGHR